jgi:hypothetical protein
MQELNWKAVQLAVVYPDNYPIYLFLYENGMFCLVAAKDVES